MAKLKIKNGFTGYPMPVVMIGAKVADQPNFMTAAWITRVNFEPPIMAVTLGHGKLTAEGILANQAFSINVPCPELIAETDYCGIVSGRKADKASLFEVFYGETGVAPMIVKCPLNLECKLMDAIHLPADTIYLGEIVATYTDEKCLTDGQPDVRKINPFVLTMPDNRYWSLGEVIGQAWSDGLKLKK